MHLTKKLQKEMNEGLSKDVLYILVIQGIMKPWSLRIEGQKNYNSKCINGGPRFNPVRCYHSKRLTVAF